MSTIIFISPRKWRDVARIGPLSPRRAPLYLPRRAPTCTRGRGRGWRLPAAPRAACAEKARRVSASPGTDRVHLSSCLVCRRCPTCGSAPSNGSHATVPRTTQQASFHTRVHTRRQARAVARAQYQNQNTHKKGRRVGEMTPPRARLHTFKGRAPPARGWHHTTPPLDLLYTMLAYTHAAYASARKPFTSVSCETPARVPLFITLDSTQFVAPPLAAYLRRGPGAARPSGAPAPPLRLPARMHVCRINVCSCTRPLPSPPARPCRLPRRTMPARAVCCCTTRTYATTTSPLQGAPHLPSLGYRERGASCPTISKTLQTRFSSPGKGRVITVWPRSPVRREPLPPALQHDVAGRCAMQQERANTPHRTPPHNTQTGAKMHTARRHGIPTLPCHRAGAAAAWAACV